jgi:hypothetical protein
MRYDYWKREKGKIGGIEVDGRGSLNRSARTDSEVGMERRKTDVDLVVAGDKDEKNKGRRMRMRTGNVGVVRKDKDMGSEDNWELVDSSEVNEKHWDGQRLTRRQ